jgi:hypothetical protein
MNPQQDIRRQLLIDGYIAHMFDPRGAEQYHVVLLRREPRFIQWYTSDTGPPDIFFASPPPGQDTNQHDWAIDYVVRDTGSVIPQQIWHPRKPADAQRYVYHEQLRPPIFFVHRNGADLGIPLTEAAAGNCMHLRGADQVASIGTSTHTQIRINVSPIRTLLCGTLTIRMCPSQWCGYQYLEWSDQIMTQKQPPARETISLEKFAKYIAGKVLKFMAVILTLHLNVLKETDAKLFH